MSDNMRFMPRTRRQSWSAATMRHLAAILAALSVFALGSAKAVAEDDPGRFLNDLVDRAVRELGEPGLDKAVLERRLRGLINENLELKAIARHLVGKHWKAADENERTAYLAAFEDTLVARFLPIFADYEGAVFTVERVEQDSKNPKLVIVNAAVVQGSGEETKVRARLRKRDTGFRILDIGAEGVSLVQTLREEYGAFLKRNGGDLSALTAELRARATALRAAP